VFASLTPHRQPHAKKWASPFFGSAHPPPFGVGETIKIVVVDKVKNKVANYVQFIKLEKYLKEIK